MSREELKEPELDPASLVGLGFYSNGSDRKVSGRAVT